MWMDGCREESQRENKRDSREGGERERERRKEKESGIERVNKTERG